MGVLIIRALDLGYISGPLIVGNLQACKEYLRLSRGASGRALKERDDYIRATLGR